MQRLSFVCGALAVLFTLSLHADPIRVLVWDEEQPGQRPTYPEFIGKHIAKHLEELPGLVVKTARLDDPDYGVSTSALQNTDVLIWWGHIRHPELPEAKGKEIVDLVEAGKLALMTLHSAHWSVPYMEAMERKAAQDALERLPDKVRKRARVVFNGKRERVPPAREARNFLNATYKPAKDGSIEIHLDRPNCVFPLCCHPVEPSLMRTLLPKHPIARGLPETFTLEYTEMYDGPYGVPPADELIFSETWADGEFFAESGAIWNVGKGKVFYLRPGHETYRVYYDPDVLKILENATVHLGEAVLVAQGRAGSDK